MPTVFSIILLPLLLLSIQSNALLFSAFDRLDTGHFDFGAQRVNGYDEVVAIPTAMLKSHDVETSSITNYAKNPIIAHQFQISSDILPSLERPNTKKMHAKMFALMIPMANGRGHQTAKQQSRKEPKAHYPFGMGFWRRYHFSRFQ